LRALLILSPDCNYSSRSIPVLLFLLLTVGRIPTATLFVVVRRRRKTREDYSVSTNNHQVPKHWFEAMLRPVLKFLKLTSGSGISSILTNQRTFVFGFLIYPQIKEPLVLGI